MAYSGYENPSALGLARVSMQEQKLQDAAACILKYFSHELCDRASDAAAEVHSEGDVGNANDCVEAFLSTLTNGEAESDG